jgi:hypothetical protein
MSKNLRLSEISGVVLVLLSVFSYGCQFPAEPSGMNDPKSEVSKSADITPTPKIDITAYEQELKSMQVAGFDYIFVLKRKDGTAFTSEDKGFVREKKHYAANRFSFIEDERTLFIGSNYEFSEENLNALKERFEFKDYSKPKEQIEKERLEEEKENQKPKTGNENTNGNSAG